MHFHVTMTIRQLSTLRLMLRLQRVRSIRIGLQKYRAGVVQEAQALSEILHKQDLIQAVDLGLAVTEHEVMAKQIQALAPDPLEPVNLPIEEKHLEFCRLAASAYYSAEGSLGSQADQALFLKAISDEAEGLRLALKTASVHDDHAPIIQEQPRGMQ